MNVQLNKWLIATVGLILILFMLFDTITEVVSQDGTYITLAIIGLFGICHMAIPKAIDNNVIEEKLWFMAEVMVAMGMIGTVTGFMLMFGDAFAALDTSDPATISAVLTDMASGLGTALVTTLTGLVAAFTLKSELVFISGDDNAV